jgi:hypothetical protein
MECLSIRLNKTKYNSNDHGSNNSWIICRSDIDDN